MSEKSLSREYQSLIEEVEQVASQVDQYLADESLHSLDTTQHSDRYDGGSHQNRESHTRGVHGGHVSKSMGGKGSGDELTYRSLHVSGEVDGQQLKAGLSISDNPNIPVARATTSDGKSTYDYNAYTPEWNGPNYLHVSRKTADGETYTHVFKDREKAKKASVLVTRLASKRAGKVVESSQEKKAA